MSGTTEPDEIVAECWNDIVCDRDPHCVRECGAVLDAAKTAVTISYEEPIS